MNANDRAQTNTAILSSCAPSALAPELEDIGLARPSDLPHHPARFDTAYKLAPADSVQWLIISDRR